MKHQSTTSGLRIVALFEGAKGVLVLLAGFGLLSLIHKDVHEIAAQIIQQSHINPAHHYPRIFLDLTEKLTDKKLWALAIAAMSYSVIRIIEAIGLWLHRRWAELFGILTGIIYIPVEIYEVIKGATWVKGGVLAVNIGIVSYLALEMRTHRNKQKKKSHRK